MSPFASEQWRNLAGLFRHMAEIADQAAQRLDQGEDAEPLLATLKGDLQEFAHLGMYLAGISAQEARAGAIGVLDEVL
jgi:hypothetical protein